MGGVRSREEWKCALDGGMNQIVHLFVILCVCCYLEIVWDGNNSALAAISWLTTISWLNRSISRHDKRLALKRGDATTSSEPPVPLRMLAQ